MKISTKPMTSKTVERGECQLVCSPNPEESDMSEACKDPSRMKACTKEKSKLSLSTKTELKESEVARLCRSKRITCQDTIHEYDEEDGLTMEKVGR